MNRIIQLILLPFLVITLTSCDEDEPQYTLNRSVDETERNVLIEEFTGVRCVNCPAGSAEIENLKSIYGDHLVAVSIHAGFFANPYPESEEDLSTSAGEEIQSYLGEPIGYPTAIINRKDFGGSDDFHLGQGEWAGAINSESNNPAEANIELQTSYNPADRSLNVRATLVVAEETGEPWYVTALITENGIRDAQKVPNMSDPKLDYEHDHVLRTVLTSTLGDQLPLLHVEGDLTEKEYDFILPDHWVAEHCHVVVLVHHKASDKRVLQVQESPIIK